MKAVIVDIEGKYAVGLARNGSFIKVKSNDRYKVGYEFDLPSVKHINIYSSFLKAGSIAAAFLLVIGMGSGMYAYSKPYSYIDVDINPSIEITANVFDRILSVKPLNSDGEKVISDKVYKNMKIEEGIGSILKNAVSEGYLKAETDEDSEAADGTANAVVLTVANNNPKKLSKIESSIETAASEKLKAEKVKSQVMVENISIERHDEAAGKGISPGKLLLLEKLQEAEPDIKTEDYKNAPVKDILKIIKSKNDENKDKVVSSKQEKPENMPEAKNKLQLQAAKQREKNGELKDNYKNSQGNIKKNGKDESKQKAPSYSWGDSTKKNDTDLGKGKSKTGKEKIGQKYGGIIGNDKKTNEGKKLKEKYTGEDKDRGKNRSADKKNYNAKANEKKRTDAAGRVIH